MSKAQVLVVDDQDPIRHFVSKAFESEGYTVRTTGSVRDFLHIAFFALAGLVPLAVFTRKVFNNIRLTGDRVDALGNW